MATGSFILDYLLFIWCAALGVLQLVAALNRLRGMQFFNRRRATLGLGTLLVAGAFVWFFASASRNQPDTGLGLDGNQQFGLFSLGVALALVFTLLAASWRHRRLGARRSAFAPGLEGLRQASYLRLLRHAQATARVAWQRYRQGQPSPDQPGWLPVLLRLWRR